MRALVDAERTIGSGYEIFREHVSAVSAEALSGRTIALDTNALLDLYRRHSMSTENILAALRRIKSQLFLPAQVQREFWLRRDTVLHEVLTANSMQDLSAAERSVKKVVEAAARWVIDADERARLSSLVDDTFQELKHATAGKSSADRAKKALVDPGSDDVLTALTDLFAGRTGEAFAPEAEAQVRAAADGRFRRRQPPGYMDADKPDGGLGDLFVWEQLIERATTDKRPVVLVTNDQKEDWWRLLGKNAPISARFELVEEMRRRAGVEFRTLTLDQFLIALADDPTSELEESAVDDTGVDDDVDLPGASGETWSASEFGALVALLSEWGYSGQAHVALAAAGEADGVLDRAQVLSILGLAPDAKLTAFTRAIRTAQKELVEQGIIRPGLTWGLRAQYDGPGKAKRFAAPPEVARAFADAAAERQGGEPLPSG
ncbi:hypothetical protein E4P39_12075 [Blastococcus sp. CT_GayMR19]|uniref:PIN domain-containing protein n=1 Tax=Blastococcus sp. CT_GayMR19 TaxID=2559608 RepID=UPI001073F7F4|nr:PIN domain-containing protein [Blastococcus sp. CT_GayMR19]TFV74988.1 hypothetical protein E4P39_12075 [Blastococcus sp. CT_GayMR19]